MTTRLTIALIKGDGIGIEVADSAVRIVNASLSAVGAPLPIYDEIQAGAAYFRQTGIDIEPDGEARAGEADAIFLGAVGLPSVRHADGTEISPHLRLRDRYGLYAGIRPVKAYPNIPRRLADPRAAGIDMVILRESTEGLFYSAAVHGRSIIVGDEAVYDTLRISREVSEKLHRFAFRLARKRKSRGRPGKLTCVDKANVFASLAFFRKIFDEIRPEFPDIDVAHAYVDAQALDLVRKPWEVDVLVTENMFGDILSDLAGGLVGGMGMAACGEIGDEIGLFQPAHGSAPDIMGQDKANPLAAILSGALMLDYLGEKRALSECNAAAALIEAAVARGFAENRLRPDEFGGDMGTEAVTRELLALIATPAPRVKAGRGEGADTFAS
ncbi:isocitrate/isopropylmalate dehydrogenase family protein [Aliiruegeria sabulilitoris]|uniref:isocitrate/isopropylmalate dehydrogenase family protein n=1 Tax=Aliiruegeria sabulilitoris TaxID=1510458 RepID=UPI000B007F3C|nr:isocitrate/isopropylmalate family dehydrogenase [Aliiruegeria sabulilitoris]